MKNMALKKPMMLGEDVVANVGFSGKGITEAAKPEYPYCLKLYLSQQELDMLEIEDLPVVGTMLKLNAKVLVSSTRSTDYRNGTRFREKTYGCSRSIIR